MCMSVPQMALRLTRIRTSFGPGAGFAISCRSMPGAERALTSACIRRAILDYAQLFADFRERCHGAIELLARVRGGHLRADARLPLRDYRIGEADHVHAFVEQAAREIGRELRVAQHDRDDRMLAWHEVETGGCHSLAKVRSVVPQPRA